jgi:hypothetical protein
MNLQFSEMSFPLFLGIKRIQEEASEYQKRVS